MSATVLARFNQLAPAIDRPRTVTEFMRMATLWLTLVVGFTVPLAASPSDIATTALMVAWLLSGEWDKKWAAIRQSSVALMALAMMSVLYAGVYYSTAGWLDGYKCLLKYREFLYIPLLIPVFQDKRLRELGFYAFVAGAIVLVGLSYFEWLTGLDLCLPSAPTDTSARPDYVTFKDRIVHSVMAAFLIYIAAWKVTEPRAKKWFWWSLIGLALFNILWLLQGRTGYVVLGSLTVLFMAQRFGIRGIAYAAVLLLSIALMGCLFVPSVQYRVEFTLTQLESHFGPERKPFWDGRLEFYSNTLTLIGRHPYLGTGTGSFEREYGRLAGSLGMARTVDPHNEYLLLTAQTGLVGACVFLALLATHGVASRRLPPHDKHLARGVLVATAVGCLFNSLLLSQSGVFFSYFSAMAFGALPRPDAASSAGETENKAAADESNLPRLAA
jgi:O-antigen ligase